MRNNSTTRTARVVAVLVVLGLLGLAAPGTSAVQAAPPGRYVALGDSFSSGEGVGPFLTTSDSPTNRCHRSPLAYPNLVATTAGATPLDFWACSGADIADLGATLLTTGGPPWDDPAAGLTPGGRASYLERLGPDVGLVTITIGGNDVGFGSVMFDCAMPWFLGNCSDLEPDTAADLRRLDDGRLADLYTRIRDAVPASARVLVVGYPRLFPTDPNRVCWLDAGFISRSERAWLNEKARQLNDVIERNTQLVPGVEYVDVEDAFEAGALCSGSNDPYLTGVDLLNPGASFHPTASGHRVLAAAVFDHLSHVTPEPVGSPVSTPPVVPPTPPPSDSPADVRGASVGLFDPDTAAWWFYGPDDPATFRFGAPGDVPLLGDWDCDGTDTVATWRPTEGVVRLRSTNRAGIPDRMFVFGGQGDVPLAGDWDGDGCDTFAVYRPGEGRVYLRNALGSGAVDNAYYFGIPGDRPFAGDFDGDGVDTVGLYRETTGFVYFRNTHSTGVADSSFYYGVPSDRILTGDWDGDGDDTVAVFRASEQRFYLSNTNTQSFAAATLDVDITGLPVAGFPG